MKYDILAIGDMVIDAFIRLKEAEIQCDANKENCKLVMRYADKLPYEFVEVLPAVGNSANAAVCAARLGLTSALRSYVGEDTNGADCFSALQREGVDTSFVIRDPNNKTNYHYVLWYESDRTILIKHEQYAYSFPVLSENPKWIYLSSMSEGDAAKTYHQEIIRYLEKNKDVKLAFQPGTFQMKIPINEIQGLYDQTEIFFCNKEEAQRILNTNESNVKKLMTSIRDIGPNMVVITDGRRGSSIMTDRGAWHAPMYPDPKPPLERTGAGDAAASTTVAYIIRGLAPEEAMLRGLINSANVVQEVGAQKGLLTHDQIEEWYARRPVDFIATAL